MEKALILGLGTSGQAAAKLLAHKKIPFYVFDDHIAVYQNWLKEHNFLPYDPKQMVLEEVCTQVILSPGIQLTHPLCRTAIEKKIPVVAEVELSLSFLDQPLIAITGTNGKTTVTLLVEHLLNQAGKKAKAVGNVGFALADYALNPHAEEILVVELSSFQLETMYSKRFSSSALLNITPDHLDRYSSFEEYAKAKAKIVELTQERGPVYVYEKVIEEFPSLFEKKGIISFGRKEGSNLWTDKKFIWKKDEKVLPLPNVYENLGFHEAENALAAFALLEPFHLTKQQFLDGLESFKKPSHRIEFVTVHKGISYFDDSKGTNIDAVIQAVATMQGPTILIAGGVDKGFPYTIWKEALGSKIKKIIAIGQAAEKMISDLSSSFCIEKAMTMQDAVEKARQAASPGDSVLLSPGCSSFDMFKDYAHRGQEFQRCVLNLQSGRKPK